MTINEFLQLMDNTLVVNDKLTLNTKRTDSTVPSMVENLLSVSKESIEKKGIQF